MTLAPNDPEAPRLPSPAQPPSGMLDRRRLASILAFIALALWGYWWITWIRQGYVDGKDMWFTAWEFLGLDFRHNDLAVKHLFRGGNPFTEPFGHPISERYGVHPLTLVLFSWCGLMSTDAAYVVWVSVIAGVLAWGAALVNTHRRTMALRPCPVLVPQALILCSMPGIFAMERGNWDVLPLAAVLLISVAARRRTIWADVAIAVCAACATWLKYYPAVLVPVLIVAARYRAAWMSVLAAILLGLVALPAAIGAIDNSLEIASTDDVKYAYLVGHSLTSHWRPWFRHFGFHRVASIQGISGAAVVLFPLAAWVSFRVFQSARRESLLLPMMLWSIQAATFWFPMSYDYKIFFLLLALLTVWSKHDGVMGIAILIGTAVWAWPFLTTDHIPLVLFLKLSTLFGVAWMLVRRARENDAPRNESTNLATPEDQHAPRDGGSGILPTRRSTQRG